MPPLLYKPPPPAVHKEFEIVTPRTLRTTNCKILILPDVKCISDIEYAQLQSWLKKGNTLISTGETAKYKDKREISAYQARMQELSNTYPNAIRVTGNPERNFYQFLKANYNQSAQKGKNPVYDKQELGDLLGQICNSKNYSPAVQVENADVCAVQIASVNAKPTVFLANFSGLKGRVNANPIHHKNIIVTFNNAKRNSQVVLISFLGKAKNLKGEWSDGKLRVTLPEISRGCIVELN